MSQSLESVANRRPRSGPRHRRRRVSRFETALAVNIGAAFEWYDFVLYAMFQLLLAKQFFPTNNDAAAVLLSIGTFAIGWVMRPLGALAIGAYSDQAGRKAGFVLSAGLMALGTLMTGLLPTYAMIGGVAPLLLVVARMIQGVAIGGGFGCATALLAEQDAERRGFYASLQWAAQGFAVFGASLLVYFINRHLVIEDVESWGWRIPFLLGALVGPVAFYIHLRLQEPVEFIDAQKSLAKISAPLTELFLLDKGRILAGAGIVAAGAAGSYVVNYLPTYGTATLGLPGSTVLVGTLVGGIISTLLPPLFGYLSDIAGRIRIMAIFGTLGLVLIWPAFRLVAASPTVETLVAVQALLSLVFYCGYYSTVPAALADLFETRRRTSGVAIAYVIAQLAFGGVTPLVVDWIIRETGDPTSPGLFLMAVTAMSLLCLIACRRLGVR